MICEHPDNVVAFMVSSDRIRCITARELYKRPEIDLKQAMFGDSRVMRKDFRKAQSSLSRMQRDMVDSLCQQ